MIQNHPNIVFKLIFLASILLINTANSMDSIVIDHYLITANGDGVEELITAEFFGKNLSLFWWESNQLQLKTDPWVKHIILDQIETRPGGFNSAAPGSPMTFYPSSDQRSKPWIFVCGDGAQKGYLLTPCSSEAHDWSYKKTVILDSRSTIGKAAIGDIDGSGFPSILISKYKAKKIAVFTIKPINSN